MTPELKAAFRWHVCRPTFCEGAGIDKFPA